MTPAEELRTAADKLMPSSPAVAHHTVAVKFRPDIVRALAALLVAVSSDSHDEALTEPGSERHDHCARTVCVPAAALAVARVINGGAR